jgi:hypothetical protein
VPIEEEEEEEVPIYTRMQFFYVYTLHIIVRGFEYYTKGQKEGCDFECIFPRLQILVLSKTAAFITRGAI